MQFCVYNPAQISLVDNLKWNHEEFQVDYSCLRKKYRVWKYFLTKLLKENAVNPFLTEVITKPVPFWNVSRPSLT